LSKKAHNFNKLGATSLIVYLENENPLRKLKSKFASVSPLHVATTFVLLNNSGVFNWMSSGSMLMELSFDVPASAVLISIPPILTPISLDTPVKSDLRDSIKIAPAEFCICPISPSSSNCDDTRFKLSPVLLPINSMPLICGLLSSPV
jgi:hypothetical protein